MALGANESRCHLYVDAPDHAFEKALRVEVERTAGELTRAGLAVRVEMRYARGDGAVQWQQIEDDRRSERRPDLFIVIPIDKDAVYTILSQIVSDRADATCVFLHQPLSRILQSERETHKGRLFSVSADQKEIGRLQARQMAAVLPAGGDVLYVQGRRNSYATAERMKGLLEELPKTPDLHLAGYRLYGDWSPSSVRGAVDGWRALGGKLEWLGAAAAQSDDMAAALSNLLREQDRNIPVFGVDGLEAGRRAVDKGTLAGTVVQPLGIGHALRMFRDLVSGAKERELIPENGNIVLAPESYPPLETLRAAAARPTPSS